VVKFYRNESNLPFLYNEIDLSTDQKYLFEICLNISCGNCSVHLSRRNLGKQLHSKWLTTANSSAIRNFSWGGGVDKIN
jgi:hypothetical protein